MVWPCCYIVCKCCILCVCVCLWVSTHGTERRLHLADNNQSLTVWKSSVCSVWGLCSKEVLMVPHGYMCRLRIRAPTEHHEMSEHLWEMWSSWCVYCKEKKKTKCWKCSLHPRKERQHRLGTNVPRMRSVHEALHTSKSRKQRADTDMMLRSVIIGS